MKLPVALSLPWMIGLTVACLHSLPSFARSYLPTGSGIPTQIVGGSSSSSDGKTRYEYEPVFTLPPRSGFMCYRLRAIGEGQNESLRVVSSGNSHFWDYSGVFSSRSVDQNIEHTSSIGNPSTWQHFFVPLPPVADTRRSSSRSFASSSSGSYRMEVEHRRSSVYLTYESIDGTELPSAQAISAGAAERAQDQLEVLASTSEFYPSLFEPDHLPADWRAFHGFGSVTLTREEWRDLSESVRRSLLEYVRLGGTLRLQSPNPAQEILPNFTNSQKHALGLGVVDYVQLVAKKSPEDFSLSGQSPALEQQVEEAGKPGFFTIMAVLALGLVLGPLNLFWFTRGKRHRLFFTIPLISLAASLLFVGIILLRDGTGGSGERFAVITFSPDFSEPNERNLQGASATIIQQQSSRSGALLATAFETEQPLFMRPLGNFLNNAEGSGDQELELKSTGQSFSGDWFQSRQRQTYELAAVVPSRLHLRVQETGNDSLEVTNGTSVALSFVSLRRGNESYYYEGEVPSGGSVKLTQAKQAEIKEKLDDLVDAQANQSTARKIREAFGRKEQIVAFAPQADSLCLDTLQSIRWKESTAVLIQPLRQPLR